MTNLWRRGGLVLILVVLGSAVTPMSVSAVATPVRATTPVPVAAAVGTALPAPPSPVPIRRGPGAMLPRTFTGLFHLVGGRWVRTRIVRLNGALRFSILVQDHVKGWSRPRVHLRIRRTFIGGAHHTRQYSPAHIFRVGMRATSDRGGYTRYVVDVRFRSRAMLGVLAAEFHIASGMSAMGAEFLFTVRA
jgi:hypothetical protein